MRASSVRRKRPRVPRPPGFSFARRLQEIDMFFQGKDPVHQTMRRIARRLARAGITYAIAGGMAVNAHKYSRTTGDVDILLSEQGFDQFCRLFVGKWYERRAGRMRRFVDRQNGVGVDVLVEGMFPGTGKPGPIAYPTPEEVTEQIGSFCMLKLETLVQLKLAARRFRDYGDVVELIRANGLDETFTVRLHPSVRRDYLGCLDEKCREDEYEAREG